MAIRGQGMADDNDENGGEGSSAAQGGKIVYVLHPNCAVEEY